MDFDISHDFGGLSFVCFFAFYLLHLRVLQVLVIWIVFCVLIVLCVCCFCYLCVDLRTSVALRLVELYNTGLGVWCFVLYVLVFGFR